MSFGLSRLLARRSRARDESGVIAVITALCVSLLLLSAALVVDFGIVRIDRQVDKSAADSAVLAGLHALNAGDGTPHPYMGVCTAVRYLKSNNPRFAGMNESVGWTDALGGARASGCTDTSLRNMACVATNKTTWARYTWSGTWQGAPLSVMIQSGYDLTGSTWVEDGLPASLADATDGDDGCNQMVVTVEQQRKPGLGSLATTSNLKTAVRSVGRVKLGPGGYAPAMLILRRTGCPVLTTGSASADTSWAHVYGSQSTNGLTQPGSIHADSSGIGCSHPNSILEGRQNNGIVTYAAPRLGLPGSPDPSRPGQISTVAGTLGTVPAVRIYDDPAYVYSSSAIGPATAGAAAKSSPTGRGLVSRSPVDERYRLGVEGMRSTANAIFADAPTNASYKRFPVTVADPCQPTQADVNALALTATDMLYIACTGAQPFKGSGDLTINAGRVVFGGNVEPVGLFKLPNATGVYIAGKPGRTALTLSGGITSFEMHTTGNVDATTGQCTTGQNSRKSVLVVKDGPIQVGNDGTLRLCRTTTLMMSGYTDACVPTTNGDAPKAKPCGTSPTTIGSGQVDQSGTSTVDWVAPDQYDVMTLADGSPDPTKAHAWADGAGPEDLALWSESATSNSVTSRLGGPGLFSVQGVFMTPNMQLLLGGGAFLNLREAQFVSESIVLNGSGSKIDMSVDPNSAITLPKLDLVGLVR